MQPYIHIPKPCHEDWNKMIPEEQGRHCLQCCKTVVDFTEWEPQQIAEYLKRNIGAGKSICGRFTSTQLENPVEAQPEHYFQLILNSGLSHVKKIAAVIIVAFGLSMSSCGTRTVGDVAVGKAAVRSGAGVQKTNADTSRQLMVDTIVYTKGTPAMIVPDDQNPVPDKKKALEANRPAKNPTLPQEVIMMGEMAY